MVDSFIVMCSAALSFNMKIDGKMNGRCLNLKRLD
jgi:hypothetical protein